MQTLHRCTLTHLTCGSLPNLSDEPLLSLVIVYTLAFLSNTNVTPTPHFRMLWARLVLRSLLTQQQLLLLHFTLHC